MNSRLGFLLLVLGCLLVLKWLDRAVTSTDLPLSQAPTATVMVDPRDGPAARAGALPHDDGPQMPWQVTADPFKPMTQNERPRSGEAAPVKAPAPLASTSEATEVLPPPPPLTIFGLLKDDKQLRLLLATPQGVAVAAVGDKVMGLTVQSIDTSVVTLTSDDGAVASTMRLPALAPERTVRDSDGAR